MGLMLETAVTHAEPRGRGENLMVRSLQTITLLEKRKHT